MKGTLDTNVFLLSVVSKSCAITIQERYHHNKNIILMSVSNETRPKLIELSTIFSLIYVELSDKKDGIQLLESGRYDYCKENYPDVYNALISYARKNVRSKKEVTDFQDRVIVNIINQIKYLVQLVSYTKKLYPLLESEFADMKKQDWFSSLMKKLDQKVGIHNDGDREHLCLCSSFIKNNLGGKEIFTFITLDKQDFTKKKHDIESVIKGLEISSVPDFDRKNLELQQ
jgi:hypothetical protein